MALSRNELTDALRVTALRRPRGNLIEYRARSFIAALVFYLLLEALVSALRVDAPRMVLGAGFVSVLADATLTLIGAWLLTSITQRTAIIWGVATIAVLANAFTSLLIHWPLEVLARYAFQNGQMSAAISLAWLSQLWWLFVLFVLARWLAPRQWSRVLPAALLAFVVSAATWWFLPTSPIFMHDRANAARNSDGIARSGFDLSDDESERLAFDPEAVMYDQPRLLDEAISRLAPRTPGQPNLFVVAFAGDGSESVFRNEAEYVEQLFSSRFAAQGHVLVLQNHPATVATRPLATWTNLRRSLAALAERMDPDEDILLLYLTSHGSADHWLYVNLEPLPLNQIGPEDLAEALATSPSIQWKVLIVNACYSGGFIDALRGDSTMVITAARHDRTSFGCGADSEITYFGNAFLADALNKTTSIRDAFAMARESVAEWEKRDEIEPHSEPQIATSAKIDAQLARWQQRLPAHPPVPFIPSVKIEAEREGSPTHD
jgi:hypothetical protein